MANAIPKPAPARGWNLAGATVTLLDERDRLKLEAETLRGNIDRQQAQTDQMRRRLEIIELNARDIETALRRLEPEFYE